MRETIEAFSKYLQRQEKSKNTVEKYVRDVRKFFSFLGRDEINRDSVLRYKEELQRDYKPSSANSMLVALNAYLRFIEKPECRVQVCRIQREIFRSEEKELTKEEYRKLVETAQSQGKDRLSHILQTIGATGIRVSELRYITVEALEQKMARVSCKGKIRVILLPVSLVKRLKAYCKRRRLCTGPIFITRRGRPMDRRNIWREMKALCCEAGVQASKVFPHNLRHLFARCYYEKERDLVRLADYLGHSSIETTRRYTMISTMEACLKQLELGLLSGMGRKKKRRHNTDYVVNEARCSPSDSSFERLTT